MPLVHNHAQQPPSGYYFPDPTGVRLRGKDIKELLANIVRYRTNNRLPAGNPELELEGYYAEKYPWLVSKVGTTPVVKTDPIERWINHIWRLAPKDFAPRERADRQEEMCKKCPHYVEDYTFETDSARRLMLLGAGRLKSMGICSLHKWACGLACVVNELPAEVELEGCWAKKRL